jgi:hypothetical protein
MRNEEILEQLEEINAKLDEILKLVRAQGGKGGDHASQMSIEVPET